MTSKKILITGGTKGIGRAAAEELLRRGHAVTVTGRSTPSFSHDLLSSISFDIGDREATTQAAEQLDPDYDVLILNAGVMFPRGAPRPGPTGKMDETFLVNVFGHYILVMRYLERRPSNRGKIRIILLSSLFTRMKGARIFPDEISKWEKYYGYDKNSGWTRYMRSKGCSSLLAHIFRGLGADAIVFYPGHAPLGMPRWQVTLVSLFRCFLTVTPVEQSGLILADLIDRPVPVGMSAVQEQLKPLHPAFTDDQHARNLVRFCEYLKTK